MRFKTRIIGAVLGVSLVASFVLVCLLVYTALTKPLPTFLTTSSPENTYTIVLKGQKSQPLFFTVEVRFDVFKNGAHLLSDRFLHSGDSEDFPFESMYPNYRWNNEQTIQFYNEEDLKEHPADALRVVNTADKTIKYARIESVDQVIIFEMKPGYTTTFATPKTKGDSKWFRVEGEFADGQMIPGVAKNLTEISRTGTLTYLVNIALEKTTIEARR